MSIAGLMSSVKVLGDEVLRDIARELVAAARDRKSVV